MTHAYGAPSPSEVIAARVQEMRKLRGWTVQQLADEMTRIGFGAWDRFRVANVEHLRRRAVSIDELFGLAYVLGVAPLALLTPADPGRPYQILPNEAVFTDAAWRWIASDEPLDGQDRDRFFAARPLRPLGVEMDRAEMEKMLARVLTGSTAPRKANDDGR